MTVGNSINSVKKFCANFVVLAGPQAEVARYLYIAKKFEGEAFNCEKIEAVLRVGTVDSMRCKGAGVWVNELSTLCAQGKITCW